MDDFPLENDTSGQPIGSPFEKFLLQQKKIVEEAASYGASPFSIAADQWGFRDCVGAEEQQKIGFLAVTAYEMVARGKKEPSEVAEWLALEAIADSPESPADLGSSWSAAEASALRLTAYSIAGDAYIGLFNEEESARADQAYVMAISLCDATGNGGMVEYGLERVAAAGVGERAKLAARLEAFSVLGMEWVNQGAPEGKVKDALTWFFHDSLQRSEPFSRNHAIAMLRGFSLRLSYSEAGQKLAEGGPLAKALDDIFWSMLRSPLIVEEIGEIAGAHLKWCSEEGAPSLFAL